jgi:hypothetical protein
VSSQGLAGYQSKTRHWQSQWHTQELRLNPSLKNDSETLADRGDTPRFGTKGVNEMTTAFTEAELQAYLDERLPVNRCAELEAALRSTPALTRRLEVLLVAEERTDLSLEGVWRRRRLSCPARSTWALYLADGLGDGLKQYLEFHLQTIGCRCCEANVDDLRRGMDEESPQRTRRVFETSVGQLRKLPMDR